MQWLPESSDNLAENETQKNIRIINISGILIGVLCLINVPVFLITGVTLLGWILIPVSLVYLGIPVINHFGYRRTARWFLFINFNLGTFFFFGLLGHGLGLEYLYVASLVGAFFLFDTFLPRAMATVVVIIAVAIGDFDLFFTLTPYDLTSTSRAWLRNLILPSSLIIITGAMLAAYVRYDVRLKALQHTIEMARTDDLTGIRNRFSFKQDGLNQLNIKNPDSALVMLDLDGLKTINDTEGHRAGDEYLRHFALISANAFPEGRIYRFGGDEFVIWLQNADNLELRLEQLSQDVERFGQHRTGVSYGICFGREADAIEQMIDIADGRMYQKKATSRVARSA